MKHTQEVPVTGGTLTVATWDKDTPEKVLAIHGITASHLAWAEVATRHPGTVIAPDLRGRGGSTTTSPYGMAAHAEDCVRLLDALSIDRATVVGHSMGGFIAATLTHRHPDRVAKLVLVDGGAPLPPVGDLNTALGPAVRRLEMRFASKHDYRDFWRAHPAFEEWTSAIESYVDYDLIGTEPELRSRVSQDAVRADFLDLTSGITARDAYLALPRQTLFLRAERGLLNESVPLYPDPDEIDLDVRTIPGTNHYSILFGADGANAVAAALA